MPSLTVHQDGEGASASSPSADIVRDAAKPEVLTDAKGRKITVRKPDVLAQYRLVRAVGPEAAANDTYMRMINPLIYVADIDGEPVHLPVSEREVEALIKRLDEHGLEAVMVWYLTNVVQPTVDAIETARKEAELKN